MKNIKAVIGSGYGDEGKGLMTDYFCSQFNDKGVVIRFNSGAQAGHTVTMKDGRRHVFGHIGSGSYRNTPTYLSKYFICNPMLFFKELVDFKMMPVIYVDPESKVTTPYDMLINQILETMRGANRHGSCGVGFNETVVRDIKSPSCTLRVKDLSNSSIVAEQCRYIRSTYVAQRFADLNLDFTANSMAVDLIKNDKVIERFVNDCKNFSLLTQMRGIELLSEVDNIVFEGAQGLLLDQGNMAMFPYLTRSNTGIQNVLELMHDSGNLYMEAVYVTRCYSTRHGNGPLNHELSEKPYPDIEDKTNIHNTWQGGIRFAYLDLDLLTETITKDIRLAMDNNVRVNKSLMVTCLDQVEPGRQLYYYRNDELINENCTGLLYDLNKNLTPYRIFTSWGPTREDVTLEHY